MLRKALRPLFAAVLLGLMRSAGAAELGEIISLSRSGDLLRVEIEVVAPADAVPDRSSCFSLAADPPNPNGLPIVWNGRATLRTLDGHHSVIVNSKQRIGETALLSLRLDCGFNARRDYLLRLPPVELAGAEVPPAAPPETAAPEAETPPMRPAKRLPPRKPLRPKPHVIADRVALSLSEADEALSRELVAPTPAEAAAAGGPANYAAAGSAAVRLDADLRELEATVARLRAELESDLRAQTGAPATPPAVAAGSSSSWPLASAEAARAVVPRELAPATADETTDSDNWLLGIAVAGTLLMLAAWVPLNRWLGRRAGGKPAEQPALGLPRASPRAAPASDVDEDAHGARGAHAIEVVEPKSPLELAEFMLSFGRVDDATIALEEHIASNPKGAIEPWLKLLEIYRHGGRRHAFDALARRMERTFNVAAPPWEESAKAPDAR